MVEPYRNKGILISDGPWFDPPEWPFFVEKSKSAIFTIGVAKRDESSTGIATSETNCRGGYVVESIGRPRIGLGSILPGGNFYYFLSKIPIY